MLTWDVFFAFVAIGSLVLSMLSIPILRLTLDRRVRKALPPDKIYDTPYDWYYGYGRTIVFGWACVFPYINNSPKLRYHYNDFDVRAFASRFEMIVAYCMVGGFSVFFIVGGVAYIVEMITS